MAWLTPADGQGSKTQGLWTVAVVVTEFSDVYHVYRGATVFCVPDKVRRTLAISFSSKRISEVYTTSVIPSPPKRLQETGKLKFFDHVDCTGFHSL